MVTVVLAIWKKKEEMEGEKKWVKRKEEEAWERMRKRTVRLGRNPQETLLC